MVKYKDHQQAVSDAVLDEQRRVWRVLREHFDTADMLNGDLPLDQAVYTLHGVMVELFPDGEPKEVNLPAGDRRIDT